MLGHAYPADILELTYLVCNLVKICGNFYFRGGGGGGVLLLVCVCVCVCFTMENLIILSEIISYSLNISASNILFVRRWFEDVKSEGARCSSVVRAFAHSAMGRRIDPSWWTH